MCIRDRPNAIAPTPRKVSGSFHSRRRALPFSQSKISRSRCTHTVPDVYKRQAKGSLRLKNKLHSATGLFCYSEFTLFEGKTMYVGDVYKRQRHL